MRSTLICCLFTIVAAGACLAAREEQPPAVEANPRAEPATNPAEARDHEAIAASAKAFEEAYNKGDAKAIAAGFGENAELVDEAGEVTIGRAAIEAKFAELFKQFPKARLAIEVESIRSLGPDVAIEEGYTVAVAEPEAAESVSRYVAIHLRRDGKWLVVSARDFPEEVPPTPHDHLQDLAWMVGDWVDESQDATVETSCRWSPDGNFLLQEFTVKMGGGPAISGTQRIGWDGLRKQFRSWVFDSEGGFAEGDWTAVEGQWIVQTQGVSSDGALASATRSFMPIDNDSFLWTSTNRVVDGELLPDTQVLVVRKPPQPNP